MEPIRFGGDVRLLRLRKSWTQVRLANEARVARWVVVAIEGGRGDRLAVTKLDAVARALGGALSVRILFRGEGLDRLRDRRHAALVEQLVRRLKAGGWLVETEVSFNVFGERGSIDILAFHPSTGALLVIEVKTVVPDVGGMFMTFDRKVRLAREIAVERFGWRPRSVSKLLVLPDASSARRRVAAHASTFANALPNRNVAINRWLRTPAGALAGLLFLSSDQDVDTRRQRGSLEASPRRAPRSGDR